MPSYFVTKIEKSGVLLRLEANGVPTTRWFTPARVSATDQLNPWIVAGGNELRVRLDWPSDANFRPGAASVDLRFEILEPGQKVGSGKPLVEFRWPPQAADQERYPFEKSFQFPVENPPPSDFWPSARPFAMTPSAKDDIIGLTVKLHESMKARDVDAAARLLAFRGADLRKSLYQNPEDARADLREYLEFFMKNEKWEIEPLAAEELQIHSLAGNRVAWVTDAAERDVIRTKSGATPGILIPLYLAPHQGKWTVVR